MIPSIIDICRIIHENINTNGPASYIIISDDGRVYAAICSKGYSINDSYSYRFVLNPDSKKYILQVHITNNDISHWYNLTSGDYEFDVKECTSEELLEVLL